MEAKEVPGENHDRAWEVLLDAARYADSSGEYARAENRYEAALASAESGGAADAAIAEILGGLFELRRDDDPAGALGVGERRLALLQELHGPEHEEVGSLLAALGCVVTSQGETKRGRDLFRRGRRILEKELGPRHPDVGRALLDMALVLRDAGREEDADPFFRRALTSKPRSARITWKSPRRWKGLPSAAFSR